MIEESLPLGKGEGKSTAGAIIIIIMLLLLWRSKHIIGGTVRVFSPSIPPTTGLVRNRQALVPRCGGGISDLSKVLHPNASHCSLATTVAVRRQQSNSIPEKPNNHVTPSTLTSYYCFFTPHLWAIFIYLFREVFRKCTNNKNQSIISNLLTSRKKKLLIQKL